MMEVFESNLIRATKKYTNLVFLTHGDFVGLENFSKFFPDIFFNFGGGEQNLISAAAGFTVRGKMPLVFLPSTVLGSVYAQLRDDICKPNLNVKLMIGGDLQDTDMQMLKSLEFLQVLVPENYEQMPLLIAKIFVDYGPVCLGTG